MKNCNKKIGYIYIYIQYIIIIITFQCEFCLYKTLIDTNDKDIYITNNLYNNKLNELKRNKSYFNLCMKNTHLNLIEKRNNYQFIYIEKKYC